MKELPTGVQSDQAKKTKRSEIDWERIEQDYRAGFFSVREIAKSNGISHAAIAKRANRDGWLRQTLIPAEKVVLDADEFSRAGFVYIIYLDDSSKNRYYKIGMASYFSARFQNHQCASPFDICVACVYYVGNMRSEERALHTEFADRRVRGEWFQLSNDDLAMIAKRSLLV